MVMPNVDTLDTYGGELENASPVEDPTTDRDAAAMNEALESTAAMTHTAARALCRVTFDAATPVMGFNDAGWGNSTAPTIQRTGAGVFVVIWPATVTVLAQSIAVSLRWCQVQMESSGTFPGFCFPFMLSSNIIRLYCFNLAGAANDLAGQSAIVRVG